MLYIKKNRKRIKFRIRKKIFGIKEKPRLSIFRSSKEIYSQIIDDLNKITLISASSKDKIFKKDNSIIKNNKVYIANKVGKLLAHRANKIGIKNIIFDRNGYLYHGRIKSFAEGAREGGLIF